MLKSEEARVTNSCWEKALDNEMMFILLARDPAAPETISFWVQKRLELGLNEPGDSKLVEANHCVACMIESRDEILFQTKKRPKKCGRCSRECGRDVYHFEPECIDENAKQPGEKVSIYEEQHRQQTKKKISPIEFTAIVDSSVRERPTEPVKSFRAILVSTGSFDDTRLIPLELTGKTVKVTLEIQE